MASVPQTMMMAWSKKKKMNKKDIFLQAPKNPERYDGKMMNSIWGEYNRYSVHNMKSMQTEAETAPIPYAPPMIQIMAEEENQMERSSSPSFNMLLGGQEVGRSRSVSRVMEQHQRDIARSRSPSMNEFFSSEDEGETASGQKSQFLQIIEHHKRDAKRCSSPLVMLAKEHYDGMRPQSPAFFEPPLVSYEHAVMSHGLNVPDVDSAMKEVSTMLNSHFGSPTTVTT